MPRELLSYPYLINASYNKPKKSVSVCNIDLMFSFFQYKYNFP